MTITPHQNPPVIMHPITPELPKLIYSANRFGTEGDRQYVGGFADRLKGICFTFALSALLDRQFFIDWDHPSRLSDIFAEKRVNWEPTADVRQALPKAQKFNLIDEHFPDAWRELIKHQPAALEQKVFHRAEAVFLNCNSLNADLFRAHADRLRSRGIDATTSSSFFRSAFSMLFSTEAIYGQPGYKEFTAFKLAVGTVIGAQFRTGGDGCWADAALDSLGRSERFSQAILDYARKMDITDFGVFLTTDSQAAKQRVADYLGEKIPFFCYSAPPVHLDRSAQPEAACGAMQIAVEHTALSCSDHIIVGAGEFGITAAYLGDKPAINYGTICPPAGWRLVPWTLRRRLRETSHRLGA